MLVPRSTRMAQSALARMSQSRFLRKYLGRPYLLMNIWICNHLSASLRSWRPIRAYGVHLHSYSTAGDKEPIRGHFLFSKPL